MVCLFDPTYQHQGGPRRYLVSAGMESLCWESLFYFIIQGHTVDGDGEVLFLEPGHRTPPFSLLQPSQD